VTQFAVTCYSEELSIAAWTKYITIMANVCVVAHMLSKLIGLLFFSLVFVSVSVCTKSHKLLVISDVT